MNETKNNTRSLVKRAQSRFIQIDEFCIDHFSLYAMAVYMQLRLLSDFSKAYDEIEITIDCIAKAAKISRRKVFDALDELENTHYVIQRLNYHHFRYGKVNSYNVARDYNFFKPLIEEQPQEQPENEQVEQDLNTGAQNDTGVQTSYTGAPDALMSAPDALEGAPNDIPNNNRSLSEVSQKKHNRKNQKTSVSVFSCTETIKTHIENTIAKRGVFVEDEIIEQIAWYASHSIGNDFELKKKVNIGLKKVREGKWNIPQGYNGITSQSIREKEEQQQREKQELYKQDAKAFQAIRGAVLTEGGAQALKDIFKKLQA